MYNDDMIIYKAVPAQNKDDIKEENHDTKRIG